MKTIFITSFHTIISRNILETPILEKLLALPKVQVVILCPKKKESFFKEEFGNTGVIIEALPLSLTPRDLFMRYLSLATLKSNSLSIKRRTEMKGSGLLLSRVLPQGLGRMIVRFLNPLLTPREPFAALLSRYGRAVIFATDMANEYDIRLAEEARRRKYPVIGMVRSWDNLTSKGMMRMIPTKLLVNNEIIKKEAMFLHGIPEEKIALVGIPHYDRYTKPPVISSEEFRRKMGIPQGNKFVLFAPAGDRYLSNNTVDRDLVHILEKSVPAEWDILVRLPPADSVEAIENASFSSRVHVYRPSGRFKTVKNTEMSREDDDILIASLSFCEIVVAGPSTMVIDSAFFRKPVLLFGFDGFEKRDYLESVRRYYDYSHFTPVLRTGGAPLLHSPEELKKLIEKYRTTPSYLEDERRKIVEDECAFTDGRSSERVVSVIKHYC